MLETEEELGNSSNERCVRDGSVDEKKNTCNLPQFLLILTWMCIAFSYLMITKYELVNDDIREFIMDDI